MNAAALLDLLHAHLELVVFTGVSLAALWKFGWKLFKGAAARRFLQPTVKSATHSHDRTSTILIRNFEATAIPVPVGVDIRWPHDFEFEELHVRAGPWRRDHLPAKTLESDGNRKNGLRVYFNELPPDAAVAVEVTFNGPAPTPHQIEVSAARDKGLLSFTLNPIKNFKWFGVGLWYFFGRLALGLGIYVGFAAWLFPGPDGATDVDVAVVLGGIVLVLLAWLAVLPWHGKDTICGHSRDPRSLKRSPAPPAASDAPTADP